MRKLIGAVLLILCVSMASAAGPALVKVRVGIHGNEGGSPLAASALTRAFSRSTGSSPSSPSWRAVPPK